MQALNRCLPFRERFHLAELIKKRKSLQPKTLLTWGFSSQRFSVQLLSTQMTKPTSSFCSGTTSIKLCNYGSVFLGYRLIRSLIVVSNIFFIN